MATAMTIAASPIVADAQQAGTRLHDSPGQAMRDQRFRGLHQVAVLARYGPAGLVADGASSDALCAEIVARATIGAPVPVTCAQVGDRLLEDTATLIVVMHASVTQAPGAASQRLFAVSATVHFAGGLEPAPYFFGAAPVIVDYATTADGRARRAHAIDAALDDVLPWRAPARVRGMLD